MRHLTYLLVVVFTASLYAVAPARAQQGAITPEAAAQQYFAAMQASDWSKVATLMHPDALLQFRDFFQALAAADSAAPMISAFFDVRTAAEFNALTPEEVYARMLNSLVQISPEMRQAMTSMKAEVVGHISEGAEAAHVVYRLHMGIQDVSMSKMEVLSLQRSGSQWLALLSGEIHGMIQALSRATQPQL